MRRCKMLRFVRPFYLLLLLLIPLYLWFQVKRKADAKLALPANRLALMMEFAPRFSLGEWLYPALRTLSYFFLIIALAGPQWGYATRDYRKKGVDIVISMDVSGSMLALDFLPKNRLRAAVDIAKDFVSRRPNDRFSLVAFSEYAITASPLTYDHAAIMNALDKLDVNREASGTAIGMGLAKGVARLKDSEAESKIVILITDGVNNSGEIDPISAAQMAAALDIKVYPIGVGSGGVVPFPFMDSLGRTRNVPTLIELDMDMLHRIAKITGTGKAARATDSAGLREIMKELDLMQRTEMSAKLNYRWVEHFTLFLALGLFFLGLEIVLRALILPVFPE